VLEKVGEQPGMSRVWLRFAARFIGAAEERLEARLFCRRTAANARFAAIEGYALSPPACPPRLFLPESSMPGDIDFEE